MENINDVNNGAQKTNGAVIGIVVIMLLIIFGGIYLAKTKMDERKANEIMLEQQTREQSLQDEAANNLSESDEVTDIEADLKTNSNIDSLDVPLQ